MKIINVMVLNDEVALVETVSDMLSNTIHYDEYVIHGSYGKKFIIMCGNIEIQI